MALDIDVIHRRGPSNEMRSQLQPNNSKLHCTSRYFNCKHIKPAVNNLQTRRSALVSNVG